MPTVKELQVAIGQTVSVRFEEITVQCTVTDVKTSWNKVRLQISPLAGKGTQWVEMGRVVGTPTKSDIMREYAKANNTPCVDIGLSK